MSSDAISDDEQPEVDDSTLSEVVRRPTRTSGDLSQVADASPAITTEDLARDLEAIASKPGGPTERELLEELLRQVRRIGEHLGIASTASCDENPMAKEQIDALFDRMRPRLQKAVAEAIRNAPEVRRMERYIEEISDLREGVRRIERNIHSSSDPRDIDSQVIPATTPDKRPGKSKPERLQPAPRPVEKRPPSEGET
jgi:Arc/MetJ family transcription regulator